MSGGTLLGFALQQLHDPDAGFQPGAQAMAELRRISQFHLPT
jgi:hypothetical protein